jgi:hypothetical protein
MKLLAGRGRRVALFRPLGRAAADPIAELLRARYQIEPPSSLFHGFSYEQAAVTRSECGTDELVQTVEVDRLRQLRRRCDAVFVPGSEFPGTTIRLCTLRL